MISGRKMSCKGHARDFRALARIFICILKEFMENLRTESVSIQLGGNTEEYQLKEKDHGDVVVYDISRNDNYLLTLSKEGDILFMNFEAAEEEREIFKLSLLGQFIDLIKQRS
jgi:hypothetical protein